MVDIMCYGDAIHHLDLIYQVVPLTATARPCITHLPTTLPFYTHPYPWDAVGILLPTGTHGYPQGRQVNQPMVTHG